MKRATYGMRSHDFEVYYGWGSQKLTLLGAIRKLVSFWFHNGTGVDDYDTIMFRIVGNERRSQA